MEEPLKNNEQNNNSAKLRTYKDDIAGVIKNQDTPQENTEEKINNNEKEISPIRTYKDDVANVVKNQDISTKDIVLAEQKRRRASENNEMQEPLTKKKGGLFKLIIALILLFLGLTVIWFTYRYQLLPEQITNVIFNLTSNENKIVAEDDIIKIDVTNKTSDETLIEISEKINQLQNKTSDDVTEISIIKRQSDSENNVNEINITTEEFFNIMRSGASDRLIRSMQNNFFLGIYSKTDEKIPFLI